MCLNRVEAKLCRTVCFKETGLDTTDLDYISWTLTVVLRDHSGCFWLQGLAERFTASPQRLFKVILVGNSSVGKTALLRRFCDGQIHSSTAATVGKSLSHSMCFQEIRSCILVDLLLEFALFD